jgi:hypothetical protein
LESTLQQISGSYKRREIGSLDSNSEGHNVMTSTILACCVAGLFAQIESGPPVGKSIPALMVQPVKDGRAADAVDITKEHAEPVTVYMFLSADRFDRPVARVVKGLDAAVQKVQVQQPTAALVLVWVAPDANAAATRIGQIQGSLQLSGEWTIFTGGSSPDGWALSDKAAITVVVTNKEKVTARFGYDSVNETVLPDIEKSLKN